MEREIEINEPYFDAKKHLTIMVKRWFYLEACLDGKKIRGLMNIVFMFFKVGGGGIWRSMLIPKS